MKRLSAFSPKRSAVGLHICSQKLLAASGYWSSFNRPLSIVCISFLDNTLNISNSYIIYIIIWYPSHQQYQHLIVVPPYFCRNLKTYAATNYRKLLSYHMKQGALDFCVLIWQNPVVDRFRWFSKLVFDFLCLSFPFTMWYSFSLQWFPTFGQLLHKMEQKVLHLKYVNRSGRSVAVPKKR